MFSELLFCENEPSPVVSLWTWACFARSATDLLLVGNWTRAPDSFQLSQPRASPQLRQRRLRQKAPSLSSPTLALTKMRLFPESPSPSLTLRTILSNSSQLVRFHAIQSNYSRKPDWRPLHFSLTRRPTAFLLSLGLQAPLRGIATKTYAPWLHIFQFVSACYFFLSSNHLPGGIYGGMSLSTFLFLKRILAVSFLCLIFISPINSWNGINSLWRNVCVSEQNIFYCKADNNKII